MSDLDIGFNVILPEVPDIPKNELLWIQGYDEKGDLRHVITSTKLRDIYFLYLYKNGKIDRRLKANTPEKFKKYTES